MAVTHAKTDATPEGADATKVRASDWNAAHVGYNIQLPLTFAKQGVVAVTTEGDAIPPLRWYNDSGRTLTFVSARATTTVAPTGSGLTVDINVDGTTIMTGTKVIIAATTTTITQSTFSTTTVADGHYVSINVDAVGSTLPGSNLTVVIWLTG